jgi:hypothetical protein
MTRLDVSELDFTRVRPVRRWILVLVRLVFGGGIGGEVLDAGYTSNVRFQLSPEGDE